MSRLASAPIAVLFLVACTTAQQRRAAENAEVRKQAAEEIERICALRGAEREAELERLKKESGMVLYCSD